MKRKTPEQRSVLPEQIPLTSFLHKPHDKYFKYLLSAVEVADELLRYCLPASLLSQMRMETLTPAQGSFVDESLKEHFTDVVYLAHSTDEKNFKIAFLFEHKSRDGKRVRNSHFSLYSKQPGLGSRPGRKIF